MNQRLMSMIATVVTLAAAVYFAGAGFVLSTYSGVDADVQNPGVAWPFALLGGLGAVIGVLAATSIARAGWRGARISISTTVIAGAVNLVVLAGLSSSLLDSSATNSDRVALTGLSLLFVVGTGALLWLRARPSDAREARPLSAVTPVGTA